LHKHRKGFRKIERIIKRKKVDHWRPLNPQRTYILIFQKVRGKISFEIQCSWSSDLGLTKSITVNLEQNKLAHASVHYYEHIAKRDLK